MQRFFWIPKWFFSCRLLATYSCFLPQLALASYRNLLLLPTATCSCFLPQLALASYRNLLLLPTRNLLLLPLLLTLASYLTSRQAKMSLYL